MKPMTFTRAETHLANQEELRRPIAFITKLSLAVPALVHLDGNLLLLDHDAFNGSDEVVLLWID